MQDCNNSSALAMELLQSCTEPSIWTTCAARVLRKIENANIIIFPENSSAHNRLIGGGLQALKTNPSWAPCDLSCWLLTIAYLSVMTSQLAALILHYIRQSLTDMLLPQSAPHRSLWSPRIPHMGLVAMTTPSHNAPDPLLAGMLTTAGWRGPNE